MNEKQNNFSLPEDYFNTSAKSIVNKIEWQEEHKEFPNLLEHRNNTVFGIPENYFEENGNDLNTLLLKKEAKIVSLFSRRNLYAVAALMVIALGFWIYGSYVKTSVTTLEDCNTLACIDKKDLLKSNIELLDNDDLYDMANLEKLEQELNTNETDTEDFE